MTDIETVSERLRTVERAVTDETTEFPKVTELAALEDRVDAVEQRVDDIDERTAELEAATQALRGYVGNIRAVNDDVEQRANAALAATDQLEARLDEELSSTPGPAETETERRQTAAKRGRQSATENGDHTDPDSLTGRPNTAQTDFSAITEGSSTDESEEPDPGVFGRIRALL